MPLTEEQLFQIAESKGIDTSKYRQKMMAEQQVAPAQDQDQDQNDVVSILKSILPQAETPPQKISRAFKDYGSRLRGVEPPEKAASTGVPSLAINQLLKQALESPEDKELDRNLKRSLIERRGQLPEEHERNFDFRSQEAIKNRAMDVRKEFLGYGPVQDFQEVFDKANQIDGVLSKYIQEKRSGDLKSAQVTDQALITLYNKILDPDSVVRESEYARSQEGQNLLNRAQGLMQRWIETGGAGITDEQRIEIGRMAKTIVNASGKSFNALYDRGVSLAQNMGVPEEMAFSGIKRFEDLPIELQIDLQNEQGMQGTTQGQIATRQGQQFQTQTNQVDLSTMSDEELRKLAGIM